MSTVTFAGVLQSILCGRLSTSGKQGNRAYLLRIPHCHGQFPHLFDKTFEKSHVYKDIFRPEKRQGQKLTTEHLPLLWPNGCLNRKKDLFPDRQRIRLLARYGGPTTLAIARSITHDVFNLRKSSLKMERFGPQMDPTACNWTPTIC